MLATISIALLSVMLAGAMPSWRHRTWRGQGLGIGIAAIPVILLGFFVIVAVAGVLTGWF